MSRGWHDCLETIARRYISCSRKLLSYRSGCDFVIVSCRMSMQYGYRLLFAIIWWWAFVEMISWVYRLLLGSCFDLFFCCKFWCLLPPIIHMFFWPTVKIRYDSQQHRLHIGLSDFFSSEAEWRKLLVTKISLYWLHIFLILKRWWYLIICLFSLLFDVLNVFEYGQLERSQKHVKWSKLCF